MKNPLALPLLVLATTVGFARAAMVDVLPGDPSIRTFGRTVKEASSSDLLWSWSASGASITFEGTACSVRMTARGSMYDVLVDGAPTEVLDLSASGDSLFELASGLAAGMHTVAVRQRTEASYSTTRFRGFRIDGTPGTAPAASARRIEFYGNSITCGYGILDSEPTHPFRIQTQDEALSYAALAADSLGAERHTICWSGRGVIQNYGGDTKNPTLPQMFGRVLASDTGLVWDFSRWIPQVVVVNLGTNDYSASGPLPDSAKFFRTYRGFVDSLHARYPEARFVLLDGPMMSDGYPEGMKALTRLKAHLDNVVADASQRGVKATHFSLSPQGALGWGADYHPNRTQAALNAKELADHLRSVADWGASSVVTESVASGRAVLERTARGISVRIPSGATAFARIVDGRGRSTWRRKLSAGSSLLPATEGARWLVVDVGHDRQILPLQPVLR